MTFATIKQRLKAGWRAAMDDLAKGMEQGQNVMYEDEPETIERFDAWVKEERERLFGKSSGDGKTVGAWTESGDGNDYPHEHKFTPGVLPDQSKVRICTLCGHTEKVPA